MTPAKANAFPPILNAIHLIIPRIGFATSSNATQVFNYIEDFYKE
jgi:hypothetical protein